MEDLLPSHGCSLAAGATATTAIPTTTATARTSSASAVPAHTSFSFGGWLGGIVLAIVRLRRWTRPDLDQEIS